MALLRQLLCVAGISAIAATAYAAPEAGVIAPLPPLERITPVEQDATDAGMLTTHSKPEQPAKPSASLPWSQPDEPLARQPASPAALSPLAAPQPAAAPSGAATYQPKSPFGRSESAGPVVPSGPHTTVAVPVVDVDAVESSEAAPPTPVPPEADPAKEDPAEPTELTSPIFSEDQDPALPRKTVLRALNKVTAQSELISLKPNETMKFGQLEITAITCRTSAPESQTDYAGLLDISERVTTAKEEKLKPLFRGWMYASSPSITALEHPVYDVTVVECRMAVPAVKKDEPKDDKPATKPSNRAKR